MEEIGAVDVVEYRKDDGGVDRHMPDAAHVVPASMARASDRAVEGHTSLRCVNPELCELRAGHVERRIGGLGRRRRGLGMTETTDQVPWHKAVRFAEVLTSGPHDAGNHVGVQPVLEPLGGRPLAAYREEVGAVLTTAKPAKCLP